MQLAPDLQAQVGAAFARDGALARALRGFVPREAQTRMALAIVQAIEEGDKLVVEAGTGVGKTFAYLAPVLLGRRRALISTASKMLQDQLFARDLPEVARALGVHARMALLKGRSSYVCLQRLAQARHDASAQARHAQRTLAQVERFVQGTRSGDLGELPALQDAAASALLPLLSSTRENCLGSACPQFRDCFVQRARREALGADVVVINHHLFFADMAVRESGMAELLPSVDVVVFDEAHELNETGVQFLGMHISSAHIADLAHDILACGLQHARGLAAWGELAGALERASRDLRASAMGLPSGSRLRCTQSLAQGIDPAQWHAAQSALDAALGAAAAALQGSIDAAPDFARLLERTQDMAQRIEQWRQDCAPDAVRWIEASAQHLRLVQAPLDIAQALQPRLCPAAAAPEGEPPERARAWIFTSATLGDASGLDWFTVPCGLQEARSLRVDSPFDYAAQAALYIPRDMPSAGDAAAHHGAIAELAAQGAQALGGRTLVLTTTLRALRAIGAQLQERLGAHGAVEVLVQGQASRSWLMERFRQGSAQAAAGCVLVASASFWQGIDVPGDALQLVIIDKLPFPPPADALVQARSQRIERAGQSAFARYSLPEAAVALRQGAGRLIRSESDTGILVIGDKRLLGQRYGARLLAALPAMRRLHTPQDWHTRLAELAAAAQLGD